ncbi:MAG: hypothetical protein KJZ84_22325 [Bryobacteraceae bacterium]|nr:hypothetical protein [Bryobacteraceae bacterium]
MNLTGNSTRHRRYRLCLTAGARWILLLLAVCGAQAVDRKSVFLDKMDGFETHIQEAARQAELKIEFIEEAEHPDLKVLLGKRFKSVQAEVMYKKNTGRNEDTTFRVVDVKTGKELLIFNFRMSNDENARRRIAQDFVRQLSGKLK